MLILYSKVVAEELERKRKTPIFILKSKTIELADKERKRKK